MPDPRMPNSRMLD
ncbi:hypothetical protein RDI58_021845 [Solanum bulbocastanum]|uniref:Uncharacterized protein n=1 Tax=Solanum bulbocastanum TaxID=147425 RepID=A0AAN8T9H7_SOLBU